VLFGVYIEKKGFHCSYRSSKFERQKMSDQQLIDAVRNNDLNQVRILLNNGANPNARVCYEFSNLL
jgi:hypothetical protein